MKNRLNFAVEKNIIAMNKNYLLPHTFKKIGAWMFLPFCAACLWLLLSGELDLGKLNWPAFCITPNDMLEEPGGWFDIIKNDPVNEIAMMGLLVSLCFIALSKEKDEDEMTGHVRMQSFVWSFWVTAAVLAFGIIFIYGLAFMEFTVAAIFLVFMLYILKFNLTMRAIRRADR